MMAVHNLNNPQPLGAPWYVMLTQPQQDITTVWRLHDLGIEIFVPVVRKRVKTGRIGRNGQKVTRIIAKPMFPGYGFLRATETNSPEGLVWRERHGTGVRGVRDFMRNEDREPIMLSHQAVLAVFRKQMEQHQDWLEAQRARFPVIWKRGDQVRVDLDGGAYAGLLAIVDKVDSRGRIEILLGMIRHRLPADMVVAA